MVFRFMIICLFAFPLLCIFRSFARPFPVVFVLTAVSFCPALSVAVPVAPTAGGKAAWTGIVLSFSWFWLCRYAGFVSVVSDADEKKDAARDMQGNAL
jgi:hypothetical protein